MATVRPTGKAGPDSAESRNGLEAPHERDLTEPVEGAAKKYQQLARWGEKNLDLVVALVSPEKAAEWLAKNCNNRPVGFATVERYVYYMLAGQWRLNGECIVLTKDERLIDGQHRLHAVVRAGIAVPMSVIVGAEEDAFTTLNQGKLRTGADTLSIKGEADTKTLASALGWLDRLERGNLHATNRKLSNMDLLKLLDEFPGIRASVEFVTARRQRGLHPPGPFAFLHFACTRKHPEQEEFFEQVLTGANLKPGSPAHVLYRRLTTIDKANASGKGLYALELLAVCIKAWNATLAGESPRLLKWGQGEKFPEIK